MTEVDPEKERETWEKERQRLLLTQAPPKVVDEQKSKVVRFSFSFVSGLRFVLNFRDSRTTLAYQSCGRQSKIKTSIVSFVKRSKG